MYRIIFVIFFVIAAGCDSEVVEEFDLQDLHFEEVVIDLESEPHYENGRVYGSITITYQKPTNAPADLRDSLNYHIEQLILCRRFWCEGSNSYEAFATNFLPDSTETPNFGANYSAGNSIKEITAELITLETWTSYYAGGASGNGIGQKYYTNIDAEGRVVKLEQLVTDMDELLRIAEENFLGPETGVYPGLFFLPPDWFISQLPNGSTILNFYFQTYDVAPGVRGPVRYALPKDKIKHIVIEEYWP